MGLDSGVSPLFICVLAMGGIIVTVVGGYIHVAICEWLMLADGMKD